MNPRFQIHVSIDFLQVFIIVRSHDESFLCDLCTMEVSSLVPLPHKLLYCCCFCFSSVLRFSLRLHMDYGLPTLSQSTISRTKKEHFNNVSIKPLGSSFAKCSLYDQLQQFLLKSPKGKPEYVEFMKQQTQHLNH